MDLTVQMDAKPGKLLNESELFSASVDARESANASDKCKCVCSVLEGKIQSEPDNTPAVKPKGALQDIYRDAPKSAFENALKGALQVALHYAIFNA